MVKINHCPIIVIVTTWRSVMAPAPSATAVLTVLVTITVAMGIITPQSPAPSPAPAPPWWSGSTLTVVLLGPGSVQCGLRPRKHHIALVDGMNLKGAATNSSLPPPTGTQPMLTASHMVVASPPYTPRRKMSFLTTCPMGTPI